MFSVTGFQNALLSSDTMSSACSRVTLFNSVLIRRAGKRLDLRWRLRQLGLVRISGGIGGGIVLAVFLRDHLDRLVEFLLGDGARGINGLRSLEFARGALEVAFFPQFDPTLHVPLTRFKADLVQPDLVIRVVGLRFDGLLVKR